MDKLRPETPADRRPLLPMPFAFVCAGVVAATAAQLFVAADDFRRIYAELGMMLPALTELAIAAPVLLPCLLVAAACLVLAGPQVVLPVRPRVGALLRRLSIAGTLLLTLYSGMLGYGLLLAFHEVKRQLQQ